MSGAPTLKFQQFSDDVTSFDDASLHCIHPGLNHTFPEMTSTLVNKPVDVNADQPAKARHHVLGYGASTATGTILLQILRLSGLHPIAVFSPRNFDLLRSYGASMVFDFADPEAPAKIKKETSGELGHALDIITDPHSVAFCYACISRFGGQ